MTERAGVWLIGALGGLATTVATGARILARGLDAGTGVATLGPTFDGLGLLPIDGLVFSGHDVRRDTLHASALQIGRENGSLRADWVDAVRDDLDAIDNRRRPGVALNGGAAIDALVEDGAAVPAASLPDLVARVRDDLSRFRAAESLDRLIVVNLASTEPADATRPEHATLQSFEQALAADRRDAFRASQLYAYAALKEGAAYVNFTPSNALVPALEELAERSGLPFMGSDGKTGETLVKSALAPMFRDRALRVLTWQGYNILGDRDGQVLSAEENLKSKVRSKDRALGQILGYPLHTHVGIDFVPSLKDMKTAWDFVHFQGFLGFPMAMQFIWQGCDAVLAAPLVLDLVRFAELALRRGERGPMRHLASYFKSPHGVDEHDFHRQWALLTAYVEAATGSSGTNRPGSRPAGT